MSKTEVISGSCHRAALRPAGNSQPKPNDGFVDLYDFVFGDGENLASLKLHYLTLGTPRRDASGAIANGVLLLHGTAGSQSQAIRTDPAWKNGDLSEGLAAEKLDQGGHTIIRDYDGIS